MGCGHCWIEYCRHCCIDSTDGQMLQFSTLISLMRHLPSVLYCSIAVAAVAVAAAVAAAMMIHPNQSPQTSSAQ